MKRQQISVDFITMVYTTWTYVALAAAVWVLLRLIQACLCLPRQLKRQTDMRRVLRDKIEGYEKYIRECEQREMAEQKSRGDDAPMDPSMAEQWKERRECLEMLKRELNKVHETKDPLDLYDYLDEIDGKEQDASITEIQDDISKGDCKDKVDKQIVNSDRKKIK
ncbi:uncharacterized protein LOC143356179 isoform X1 [Halictus rubicundus]|uniref:uncharacterized protein LOC143356179 isoform X1 n=2 Tax=Halictus rubicundus TaxID=77578 RepID=UPI004036C625